MPAMDATTTNAFATAGVDSSAFWGLFQYGVGTIVSLGFWGIKAAIPVLGVLALIGLLLGILYGFFRLFRRSH